MNRPTAPENTTHRDGLSWAATLGLLMGALALLLAALLLAGPASAQYARNVTAETVNVDGSDAGTSYSTTPAPSGCASGYVPYFDASLKLVCSPTVYAPATDTTTMGSVVARNVTVPALATPVITPPLTVNGTAGATTYGYKATALLADGTSTDASAAVTIATGNATLSAVNSISGVIAVVPGAVQYKVYRVTGNAATGEVPPRLISTQTGLSFTDVGGAGTSETPPTTNGTGVVTAGRVVAGNGTAAAPSIAAAAETGTGLSFSGGILFNRSGVSYGFLGTTGFRVHSGGEFGFSGSANPAAADTTLSRGGAARPKSNGGFQLTTGTRPTCDATTRGTFWYVAGGAGVADTCEICRKDNLGAYAWVTLF